MAKIQILNPASIQHTAWRGDFHPVVKHIYVNFSADNLIISVDHGVDQNFPYSPEGVIAVFFPVHAPDGPWAFGIIANKGFSVGQKGD